MAHVVNVDVQVGRNGKFNYYDLQDSGGAIRARDFDPLSTLNDPTGTQGVKCAVCYVCWVNDILVMSFSRTGAYAWFVGRLDRYNEKNQLLIARIRPLEDRNEIFHHILRCMMVTDDLKRRASVREYRHFAQHAIDSHSHLHEIATRGWPWYPRVYAAGFLEYSGNGVVVSISNSLANAGADHVSKRDRS